MIVITHSDYLSSISFNCNDSIIVKSVKDVPLILEKHLKVITKISLNERKDEMYNLDFLTTVIGCPLIS